ncbi:CCC motif membrane protein [Mesonia sp. K7]|uniref:CCC motif membrane protein n=1 Tax=Mesonia sp. K7 TaxID=2218606 RepID=UPI000DA9240E|nr:CCC motif membrane protein [Mesonia sp. K7]PZD77038.1 DUF4190 domain-containing protein [Mesonia sp. K7]
MENRKLPNATISLVLGIISYVACCFSWGIGGIVLSGIALYLSNKDRKTYALAPEQYDNYSQVKTARIIAIIGLVLAILFFITCMVMLVSFGSMEAVEEWAKEMQQAQLEAQGQ